MTKKRNELIRELSKRGTAEVTVSPTGEVTVNQVTQAIDEQPGRVKLLLFGELREFKCLPIEQVCSQCSGWKPRFKSVGDCQAMQKKDAEARGFHGVVCPRQLRD